MDLRPQVGQEQSKCLCCYCHKVILIRELGWGNGLVESQWGAMSPRSRSGSHRGIRLGSLPPPPHHKWALKNRVGTSLVSRRNLQIPEITAWQHEAGGSWGSTDWRWQDEGDGEEASCWRGSKRNVGKLLILKGYQKKTLWTHKGLYSFSLKNLI